MISPRDIDSVVSQGKAEDLRQDLLARSESDSEARRNMIYGNVSFDNGSNFTILNPEGQTQNVSVRADQNGDLFALIDEADGTQSSVPLTDDVKAKLQEMASAHIRDRYEQMEAEIAANNEQGSNEDASQSEQQEEQAQAPEAQEAAPEHAYEQDHEVQYVDADGVAHTGTVLEFDPNGYYIVQFDNPPTGKKLIDSYTEAELDAMTGRESNNSEAAAEAPRTESASSPIVENGMGIFDMPEAAPSSPAPTSDTTNQPSPKPSAPAAPQQRAIDRIPVDENGNHVFEHAPVEDTAAALIEQMGDSADEAIDNAQMAIRQLTEEAKKATA